jgi:glyoxylase-like metal-dependent hydrolase (beta-lactamase superfamily II)
MPMSSSVKSYNRRGFVQDLFVKNLIGGAAGFHLWRGHLEAQQAAPALASIPLADRLTAITGAGSTAVMVTGDDGLLLVDGGLPDRSPALLKTVAELGQNKPVRILFNTHWHLDHTGSNETLGKAGAKIVAHRNTKRWLSTRVYSEAQDRVYPPRPPEAIPTETFTTTGKMTFGKIQIEYGHLPPAHTDGDIYLYFPDANILMVSDILAVGRYPVMDYSTGGWIGGMIDAANQLMKIGDENTRLIPGAGAFQTKAELKAEIEMLTTVKDRVQTMLRAGKGPAEAAAEAPTKEFDAKWGKPDLFVSMAYIGLARHTHEIGGIL